MPVATMDAVLTRADKSKDVVLLRHPTIPDRLKVHSAYRLAAGYIGDSHVRDENVFNGDDIIACAYACLGLGWTGQPLPDLQSFRQMGRDVVAYGEAVATAMYVAGYTDPDEVMSAGLKLYTEAMNAFFEAHKDASEGFPKAPQP